MECAGRSKNICSIFLHLIALSSIFHNYSFDPSPASHQIFSSIYMYNNYMFCQIFATSRLPLGISRPRERERERGGIIPLYISFASLVFVFWVSICRVWKEKKKETAVFDLQWRLLQRERRSPSARWRHLISWKSSRKPTPVCIIPPI